MVIAARGVAFEVFQHAGGFFAGQRFAPALIVDHRLRGEFVGFGDVEFAVEDRIARGVFVDVGGAVPDPLAGDKDGQFDVQLDLAHLERGRVPVAHQVADQPFVVLHRFGAFAVGHARRLTDRGIVAHIVDDADEAVVEHVVGFVKVPFHPFGHRAQRGFGIAAQCVDFGLLVWGDGHVFLRADAV